jgi:hypothetical protein
VLARYSLWGIVWLVLAGAFAIAMTWRFVPFMTERFPDGVVYVVVGTLCLAFFVPVLFVVGKPLVDRVRN